MSSQTAIIVAIIGLAGVMITAAVSIVNALITQGSDILRLKERAMQHEVDLKKEREMNAALEERINQIVSGDH